LANIFVDQHVARWLTLPGQPPYHIILLESNFWTLRLYHPLPELI
jgi:hypothetical protein